MITWKKNAVTNPGAGESLKINPNYPFVLTFHEFVLNLLTREEKINILKKILKGSSAKPKKIGKIYK